MCIIYCNLQLFSNDQMIHVVDTESGITHYVKADIEDVVRTICALTGQYDVKNIKLSGTGSVYANAWATEIEGALALNYGNNNINVEVI